MTKDAQKTIDAIVNPDTAGSNSPSSGSGQIPIDCTGLRKGQYIIYINVDGDKYAEKVNF